MHVSFFSLAVWFFCVGYTIRCKRIISFLCVIIGVYRRNIDDFCNSVFKRWLHFKWVANVDLIKKFKNEIAQLLLCVTRCTCFMSKQSEKKLIANKKKTLQSRFLCCTMSVEAMISVEIDVFFLFYLHQQHQKRGFLFANYCLRLVIKVNINWISETRNRRLKREIQLNLQKRTRSNRIRSRFFFCGQFFFSFPVQWNTIVFHSNYSALSLIIHQFFAITRTNFQLKYWYHPERFVDKDQFQIQAADKWNENEGKFRRMNSSKFYYSSLISLIGKIVCTFKDREIFLIFGSILPPIPDHF